MFLKILNSKFKIVIVALFLFATMLPLSRANAAWLSGWAYRRAITIDNTATASALTNYQVSVDTTNSIYNNNGLVGSWHLNEGAGTEASDSSGIMNNGSLVNAPTWVAGKYGDGLSFSGTTKVQMATPLLIGTGDFSIEAWIYPTVSGGADYITGNYGSGNTGGIEFYKNGASNLVTAYIGAAVAAVTPVNLNAWNHVVATRSNGIVSIFINGVLDNRGALATSIGGSRNWTIGNGPDYTSEVFDGKIDEVRVYNRALSNSEVADHYSGLKARLDYDDVRFTDSDGSTLIDYWRESDKKSWVEVPSIPASSQDTIYMYYGNSSATSGLTATGGTITYTDSNGLNPRSSPAYAGGYTVHTFTSGGTFMPGSGGAVDYLVVAGGGGGGTGSAGNANGGGGGAGGLRSGTGFAVTAQAYTVTVGGGGGSNTQGSNSIFSTITSTGGGRGGIFASGPAGSGGSGGGGAGNGESAIGSGNTPATSPSQGNNGGVSTAGAPPQYGAGGGGGSSAVGGTGGGSGGGIGGAGTSLSISGASVTYAGGGGGAGDTVGGYGAGGAGGGGRGGAGDTVGGYGAGGAGGGGRGGAGTDQNFAGTANTGGGGGGGTASSNQAGGAGGSGIVIIRYRTPLPGSSNGVNTFDFFDDFSGDLSKWTNPCSATIVSGYMNIPLSYACDSTPMYVTSLSLSDAAGYTFEFKGLRSGGPRITTYQRRRAANAYMTRVWTADTATSYYQEFNGGWGTNTNVGANNIAADAWYKFGVKVKDGTDAYYINDGLIGSMSVSASITPFTDLSVGIGQHGTAVKADDVRVRKSIAIEPPVSINAEQGSSTFTKKRTITVNNTSGSVLYDYQLPIDLTTTTYDNTGLVGSWHFNEGAGNSVADSSGNNNNGTWAGTGTRWTASGKFGNGGTFNGSNDTINIGSTILNTVTSGSVSMWINPTSAAANGGSAWLNTTMLSNDNIYLGLQLLSDYKIRAYYWNSDATPKYLDSASSVSAGSWYFITYTWSSSGSSIYINGVLSSSSSSITWSNVHSGHIDQVNYIGSINGGSYFYTGSIDEVKIYSRALSVGEISDLYNASKARLDFADLRFTDDGTNYSDQSWASSYSYWLESDKKAWVKIPSIAASANKTIYLYSGNSNATSQSNGRIVFPYEFSDFEYGFDGYDPVGTRVISGAGTGYGYSGPAASSVKKLKTFPSSYILEANAYPVGPLEAIADNHFQFHIQNATNDQVAISIGYPTDSKWSYLNTSVWSSSAFTATANKSSLIKFTKRSDNLWNLEGDGNVLTSGTAGYASGSIPGIYMYRPAGYTTYFDNIRIRKYTATEPTIAMIPLNIDCGFKVFDGTSIVTLGCEPAGTLTSPLRMGNPYIIPQNGLVASWKFNEGSGSSYSDQGTLGTISGASWSASGHLGSSLSAASAGQYFDSNIAINSLGNTLSIGAWVKFDVSGTYRFLGNGNNGFVFQFDDSAGNSTIRMMLGWDGGYWGAPITVPSVVGQWTHVVGVSNNRNLTTYVNGVASAPSGDLSPKTNSNSQNLRFYCYPVGNYCGASMKLDDAFVYNRALSGAEVLAIYNGQIASTYGLKLVDTTDSDASKFRVQTTGGTKSIMKYSQTSSFATGGTISVNGGYTTHAFDSSGTFTPTSSGNVEVLVVAGGGGGGTNGSANDIAGGGGGGGGVVYSSSYAVTAGTPVTVTVGLGGTTAQNTAANNGQNSVFGSLTATGGGRGGGFAGGAYYAAGVGGSGGGGVYSLNAGAAGTASQGNAGGSGTSGAVPGCYAAGGGGGAGAIGQNQNGAGKGGDGGAGVVYSLIGTTVYYGGGGGGGSGYQGQTYSLPGGGGIGGGGMGSRTANGIDGVSHTGGGGGGAGNTAGSPYANSWGGAGGSGIVIVRYTTP